MLQESFKAFGAEQLRPGGAESRHRREGAGGDPRSRPASSGLTMLGVPEELGGAVSERSSVTAVLAAEALAHGDMGLAVALLAPAGVASALALWGDGDQQATYLPRARRRGRRRRRRARDPGAACAVRPVRAGDDRQTRARRLRARRRQVARARWPRAAELLLVAARLEGHGPVLFLVETKTSGVLVKAEPGDGRARRRDRRRAAGGRPPACERAAGRRRPAAYAAAVRRARLAWCALACGTGRAVLDYVIPHVNERVAFGEPISNRQSVAFTVSDIAHRAGGHAARDAARRRPPRRGQGRRPGGRRRARSCAREKGAWIGSNGVQLLGGHGYVKEHPVERWYRDLRAVGVAEGALLV